MKATHSLLFLMFAFFLSCEGDKIDYSIINRSIKVNARIDDTKTRAISNEWSAGDVIGIYMLTAGETLSENAVLVNNAKYTTQGDGVFTPATIANDVKLPIGGASVDFIAYYPQGTVRAGFGYPLNVTDQSNQAAIDAMYSNNEVAKSSANSYVSMRFTHKLSKLIFNISSSVAGADMSDLKAKLTGFNPRGKLSLVDGTVSYTTTKSDIRLKVSADGKTVEAIVIPTADLAGKMLIIEHGTAGYEYNLGSATNITELKSGFKYTYNLTLDPTVTELSISAAATISAWSEGPAELVTINKKYDTYQPIGKGTQAAPYSVVDAKNIWFVDGVWVQGYIVGYYTSTLRSFTNSPSKPETPFSALAIAKSPGETEPYNTFPVQLPSGTIRTKVYEGYESNFKKQIKVKGNITSYYGTTGMQNTSASEFVSAVP